MRLRLIASGLIAILAIALRLEPAIAQGVTDAPTPPSVISTDSPADLLRSVERELRDIRRLLKAYRTERTYENYRAILSKSYVGLRAIDLSGVARANRREVGSRTIAALSDIFARLPELGLDQIPTVEDFEGEKGLVAWRIPGTPIRIVRMSDGPREGEFLFEQRTPERARDFLKRIQSRPILRPDLPTNLSRVSAQLVGPAIPQFVVDNVPETLEQTWHGAPIWKTIVAALIWLAAFGVAAGVYRLTRGGDTTTRLGRVLRILPTPLSLLVLVYAIEYFIDLELNFAGEASDIESSFSSIVYHLALAWCAWLVLAAVAEWIIESPKIPDDSLDANLLRLLSRVLGVLAVVAILAIGADDLGLHVYTLLAGLGIGGLGVALAIRPTLENLFAGLILYIDRPVAVGDFCSFAGSLGTVEKIGIRSTRIRTLERTILTLPNAAFSEMQVENYGKRDRLLFKHVLSLRYETTLDQMDQVLDGVRQVLRDHPKVSPDPARVRFVALNEFSKDVEIFAYLLSTEINEFLALQEELLLKIEAMVLSTGAEFAFPSSTTYLARDK